MTKKEEYRVLCEQETAIPLFSQAWWLDATAGKDGWDVVTVKQNDAIIAILPYIIKRKYGLTILTQPPLTQFLGPWIRNKELAHSNSLAIQKDTMEQLIQGLPDFSIYRQNWSPFVNNWLPFYWSNFEQTTRYTYVLPDLSDLDKIWSNLRGNIRREIKKARNRHGLRVRTDLSIDQFISLNEMTFARQDMRLPYSPQLVKRLDAACTKRNARQLFIAEDENGKHHAGVYIVWDQRSAYYLMGGGDPELRNSGATSLCMWEAINFTSTVTERFDFEGSMIESVERFFRAFGAIQTPYFSVSKTPSRLLRTALFLRSLKSDK